MIRIHSPNKEPFPFALICVIRGENSWRYGEVAGLSDTCLSNWNNLAISRPQWSDWQMQGPPPLFRTLLLCVIFAAFTFTAGAESWLTNGLVAYYPFNGNAEDESGNGNTGIVHGPTLAPDRFGIPSSAFNFTSFGQYITSSHANGFPLGTNDFTVSLWVNVTPNSTTHQILLCNGQREQFQIHIGPLTAGPNSQTEIGFQLEGKGAAATPFIDWITNRWYNVQVVRFGDTIAIFRDGTRLSRSTNNLENKAFPTNQNLILGYRPDPRTSFTAS